jgi:hypothetical protein
MAPVRAFELISPVHDCLSGKISAKMQLDELHAYCITCGKWWHRHNNYWIEGKECSGRFCLPDQDFSSEGMVCHVIYMPPRKDEK